MVLYLQEDDVENMLDMSDTIRILEEAFAQQGQRNVINNPRQRVRTGSSMLHYLAAALPQHGVMGYKAYTSSKSGLTFRVFLHEIETGRLLSIMDGNYMGMVRTGAVSGLATKLMSRRESAVLGVFGTGWQSRGQIMAVCRVRNIKKIKVFGRNEERKAGFCEMMSEEVSGEIVPVKSPEDVLKDSDIIVTATTSSTPVFDGKLIEAGTHINAIGGNFLFKQEVDERTVRRSNIIAVESIEQCKIEAGELAPVVEKGRLQWDQLINLGDIVTGRENGRTSENDITLFKSVGIAMEDICVAKYLYDRALESGKGREIDIRS